MPAYKIKKKSPEKKQFKTRFLSFESRHFISLLFILLVLFVAVAASMFAFGIYTAVSLKIHLQTQAKNQIVLQGVPKGESPYLEKGSPLDHREVNPTIANLEKNIIFHGPRDKKEVALTFDAEMTDGMKQAYFSRTKSYDPRIIQTLIDTNTKATLFLTGMWVELYTDEAHSFGQNPLFEIGSHSYADTSYDGYCYGLKEIADTQDVAEIEHTQRILKDLVGVDNKLFRFPGGCYGPTDLDIVESQEHLTIVHWDVVGADGFNQNPYSIVRNVLDNVQNGSIIVLHMNGAPTAPKTADALPIIISELKKRGFTFVKVSELLGLQ